MKTALLPMSASGHKRTLTRLFRVSALPPKADIGTRPRDVRFVPKAEVAVIRSVERSDVQLQRDCCSAAKINE